MLSILIFVIRLTLVYLLNFQFFWVNKLLIFILNLCRILLLDYPMNPISHSLITITYSRCNLPNLRIPTGTTAKIPIFSLPIRFTFSPYASLPHCDKSNSFLLFFFWPRKPTNFQYTKIAKRKLQNEDSIVHVVLYSFPISPLFL